MVISLARAGLLDPVRGDVVLFANTTAEHPETYDFARSVCAEVEATSGVPCLWYEYCTYETAARTGWVRREGYRLVNKSPRSDSNPDGFLDDGSAFEELTSMRAMLPNRQLRFCTQALKIKPGIQLLSEWFGGSSGPSHLGHHHKEPQHSAQGDVDRYKGSKIGPESYKGLKEFIHTRPHNRPEQIWQDFTSAMVPSPKSQFPTADLSGRYGAPFEYLTLLGLRADEQKRVTKAVFDAMMSQGTTHFRCRSESHPAGEHIACPLHDHGASKSDVDGFWAGEDYDLGIDGMWGNCVYCPMKGEALLRKLAHTQPQGSSGPSSVEWWAHIEEKYGRPSTGEDTTSFRFLSLRSPTYREISVDPAPRPHTMSNRLPCSCSD